MLNFLFIIGLVTCEPNFVDFIKKFDKTYDNEELSYRFKVFEDNLGAIRSLNEEAIANGGEAVYGVTKFSDLTTEEFNGMYTGFVKSDIEVPEVSFINVTADDVDWREKQAITPIKNQGSCGSCWAFSAVESIESDAFLFGKYSLYELGPQQVVSCDKGSNGCNGGDPATAFKYVASNGMEKESDYPYTAKDSSCKFNAAKVAVKITGQGKVSGGEAGVLKGLQVRPLSVCHNTGGWQHYSGGVMTSCSSGGGHCTQMVGYASSGDYWIVKNSWGTSWGNSGYLYLKKGSNLCGIANHVLYPTF